MSGNREQFSADIFLLAFNENRWRFGFRVCTHTHTSQRWFVHQDTFSISSRPDGATGSEPFEAMMMPQKTDLPESYKGFGVGFHLLLESGAKGDACFQ